MMGKFTTEPDDVIEDWTNMWNQWGYSDYAGGYGGYTSRYSKVTVEEIIIGDDKLAETIVSNIAKSIDQENVILVEYPAAMKMMQMIMAMDGLEVYAKLIVEMEEWLGTKYPCVKDIVIPYQRVSTAHFESTTEHMAKWMNEINRNPDGSLRPVAEVNELTQKLLGHFHSHDSVGGGTASWTDSEDMREHREGAPYWVELIGSRKGFHGRIAVTEPTPLISTARVIVKWWTGIEETLGLMSDRVFEKKTTYEYITPPKTVYTKPPVKQSTGFTRDSDGNAVDTGTGLAPGRSIAQGIMGDGCKVFGWDKTDPVQVVEGILDEDIINAIVELFEGTLLGDEELLVELWDDGTIEWTVYEDGNFSGMILDLMDDRFPDQYSEYLTLVTNLGISEMFTTMRNGEAMLKVPRSVSWDNVPPDAMYLSEYVSLITMDKYTEYELPSPPKEIDPSLLPEGMKITAVDGIPVKGANWKTEDGEESVGEILDGIFDGEESPDLSKLRVSEFME